MNYKVNVLECFNAIVDEQYCIIKNPLEFPEYSINSDINIFCLNIPSAVRKIITVISQDLPDAFSIKFYKHGGHSHLDVLDENKELNLKFDFINSMMSYQNILLKDSFFGAVISGRVINKYDGIEVFQANKVDDLIFRYVEYNEYYSKVPDKIKHVDYILNAIADDEASKKELLDKLHYYIAYNFKNTIHTGYLPFGKIRYGIAKIISSYKVNGFKWTCKAIVEKVFKR